MKKRILALLAIAVLVLAGTYYYLDSQKERLFFVENPTIEVNTEFKEESIVKELLDGTFKDVSCDISKLKTNEVGDYQVIYTYRKLQYETTVHVKDTTAPVICDMEDISVEEGTKVDLQKDISATDNSNKDVTLDVDASTLDTNKPGNYEVTYTATDASGNVATKTRKVEIKKKKVVLPKVNANVPSIPPSGDKVVYLTFDDGPSYNTKRIIDILARYNAKATFFVTGNGQNYNQYIQEAHAQGHTIALHTFSHNYASIYASPDAYFADLDKVASMVEGLIGFRPHYIRFPGGASNTVSRKYCSGIMSQLTAMVGERGYKYYDWNASTGDASGNNVPVSSIISSSTSSNANNIMLLAHDTAAKNTTVEALPSIIEYYQNRGYVFKGIDDSTFTPHQRVNN